MRRENNSQFPPFIYSYIYAGAQISSAAYWLPIDSLCRVRYIILCVLRDLFITVKNRYILWFGWTKYATISVISLRCLYNVCFFTAMGEFVWVAGEVLWHTRRNRRRKLPPHGYQFTWCMRRENQYWNEPSSFSIRQCCRIGGNGVVVCGTWRRRWTQMDRHSVIVDKFL